jgi:hypothetical protein
VKFAKKVVQDLQSRQVFMFEQRAPLLQENRSFKHTVSRVVRKGLLHHNFIADMPERPALSREKNPNCSRMSRGETRNNAIKVSEGRGIPVNMENSSNPTPHESSKGANKKDVICRFNLSTQHTKAIRGAKSMINLFTAREAINGKLPGEDLNFQGKVSVPNKLGAGPSRPL